ncbi:pectin lyase [Colletotrichum orchidophilum]|uniref:Pectin lyase n=1 Tax=Colletotrichum orchidophilum TaxID=1209926 RepID=A0A1G4BHI6_9PEZI|nr:pectin lyase [Colletotrichum orchidophilum]OHF00882.1 pectin lyase [Colletotrichum orchidophilum]
MAIGIVLSIDLLPNSPVFSQVVLSAHSTSASSFPEAPPMEPATTSEPPYKSILGSKAKGILNGKGLCVKTNGKNVIINGIEITNLNPSGDWRGDAIDLQSRNESLWIDHNKISRIGRHFTVTHFAFKMVTDTIALIEGNAYEKSKQSYVSQVYANSFSAPDADAAFISEATEHSAFSLLLALAALTPQPREPLARIPLPETPSDLLLPKTTAKLD